MIAFEPDEIERPRHPGGRRVGAVRVPVPRVRRPGAAAAPPRPRPAHAAVAAAPARAALLEVAVEYPSFPIVLETMRECLQDVFDVPALVALMRRVAAPRGRHRRGRDPPAVALRAQPAVRLRRRVRLRGRLPARRAPRRGARARPGAAGRAARPGRAARAARPRRPRRDRGRAAARRPRDGGPATPRASPTCCAARTRSRPTRSRLAASTRRRRPTGSPHSLGARARSCVRIAGEERWAAIEDAGRLRDALGVAGAARRPRRVHRAGRRPARRPGRPLSPAPTGRSRSPTCRRGSGSAPPWPGRRCSASAATGRVLEGEFRPGGSGAEWCDAEVLRMLRRRSLARLRHEVEPVEPAALGAVPARLAARRGPGAADRAASTACSGSSSSWPGAPLPAIALESLVLPARVRRLRARAARRADRLRRGALGRPRRAARRRRLGLAAPRRPGAPHAARPSPATTRSSSERPPGGARRARAAAAPVLPPAGRPVGRRPPTTGAGRRPVGPGLGRPAHQRHPRAAARPHARRLAAPTAAARAGPARAPAGRGRPDAARPRPARRRAGRWSLLPERDPDPTRRAHADGRAAARPPRRRHPRRGRQRAHAGRLRRRLQGALGVRGHRPLPPRLLRRGPRRRPVRTAGRGRPAAHLHRARRPRPARRSRRPLALAATDPANPYGAALPWPDREDGGRPPARPQGRRARRARRRRAHALRRARRPDPADLDRRRRAARARPPTPSAGAGRRGALGRLTVERADGEQHPGRRLDPARATPSTRPASSRPRAGCGCRADRCPRATPSGAPRRCSTSALSGHGAHRAPTSGCRRSPPRTSPAATVIETVSRGKHLLTRIDDERRDPAHPPQDGGRLAGAAPPGARWPRPRPHGPGRAAPPSRPSRRLPARRRRPRPHATRRTDLVGHLGPDLLGPDWDADEAVRRLREQPDRTIGEALLDQRHLAGVGNVYAAELCFLTGVAPAAVRGRGARPATDGRPGPPAARPQPAAGPAEHHR